MCFEIDLGAVNRILPFGDQSRHGRYEVAAHRYVLHDHAIAPYFAPQNAWYHVTFMIEIRFYLNAKQIRVHKCTHARTMYPLEHEHEREHKHA